MSWMQRGVFPAQETKPSGELKYRYITIFADASFDPDTGASGWAMWARDEKTRVSHAEYISFPCQNSTEAEVIGLGRAILKSLTDFDVQPGNRLSIQCDNQRALAVFEYGMNLTEMESKFYEMVIDRCNQLQVTLHPKHVKGHSGTGNARSYINTWCDDHAKQEMRRVRKFLKGETATIV